MIARACLVCVVLIGASAPWVQGQSVVAELAGVSAPLVNESVTEPTPVFSFAFVGCNRIDRDDIDRTNNPSTANVAALKRLFNDMNELERRPDLFFFLGDMVFGLGNEYRLKDELSAWVDEYDDIQKELKKTPGFKQIEMVAVPGNHEMLRFRKPSEYEVGGKKYFTSEGEYPLENSIDRWMTAMSRFIPANRDKVTTDSHLNQATFAFTRKNVGFVVMNTDTFNTLPNLPNEPALGKEGMIPRKWIAAKVKEYQKDTGIDHVFVLGHKPYYVYRSEKVDGQWVRDFYPTTGHQGLPDGKALWRDLRSAEVVAMLSAHVHEYQRVQPDAPGPYQIIAGNAGSTRPSFFGYSLITIMSDNTIDLASYGYTVNSADYMLESTSPTIIRDQTTLTWSKNGTSFP